MGTIYYGGSATPIHIEDRALIHLKVVIATKLRRNERFTVSWRHPEDQPRGRTTIWMGPSIPLRFVFDDPEPAELCLAWIEELINAANSTGGIMLISDDFHTDPLRSFMRPGGLDPDRDGDSHADPDAAHLEIDKLSLANPVLTRGADHARV